MSLDADKEQELNEAFNLYCIYNPETDHFDKDNEHKIMTTLLGHVVRAVGCSPTSMQMEELQAGIGGDFFTLDQARNAVKTLLSGEQDSADDICTAYDVLAEAGHKADCIEKGLLAQKMKRRLVTDYLTDQMLADAQPDGDGWVNYKAFVERQFAVKNLSIKMKPLEKDPSVAAVKQKLQTIYGDPAGPKYPYPYKTNQQLYAELGGKGDETRKYLAFGKEQLGVLKEAIGAEQQANVVEEKIKALAESTSVPETAILLREIEASHTGYKHVLDLQSVTLKVTGMLDDLSPKEQQQVEKLEQQRQRIIAKWTEYTG